MNINRREISSSQLEGLEMDKYHQIWLNSESNRKWAGELSIQDVSSGLKCHFWRHVCMSRPSAACSLDILCSPMFSTQITDIWKTTELPEPSRSVRAVSTNVRDRKSVWMFVVECLLHSIFCTLPAVMNSMRNNATTSLCCVCNSADTVHLSFSLFFNQILCKMS